MWCRSLMASGPDSRAAEQPPALPVKQHRSHSSTCSRVETDCVAISPSEHQYQACNNVFPEPTDCHAAQCPIHQRYDQSRHQARFFSDGTPPPVPKKRVARTVSLPAPPLSPLSPRLRQPQDFDNPLYMLAPIFNTCFHEDTADFSTLSDSPLTPILSLSQLTFDTPDEHLLQLFRNFEDQRVVFQGIQHRQLVFLGSVAQSIDARILLQEQASERDISTYQPQDFLLCEESKQNGDRVYYSLHSPKHPGRLLALRVYNQTGESPSAHTKQQHVNVQHVVAHFQPRTDTSYRLIRPGCTATNPPGGGSTERATDHNPPSVQSFLQKGYSVSVERDVPHFTLEDFVENSSLLLSTACLDYHRQVCVLLLQILMGSHHLYNYGSAAELRPRDIMLVWPRREEEEGRNKLEQSASEIKSSSFKEEEVKIEILWRTRGSPRVVLTPVSSTLHVPHFLIYIKSQIGALIQYCLHSQESLASLSKSSYQQGLLYLVSLLQTESSSLQMVDMIAMLQVLLWGPRVPLFDQKHSVTTIAHNWLTTKRALLVMKLAERGLIQDGSLDWEESLCLKYLSFTDTKAVVSMVSQLRLNLNIHSLSL